MPSKLRCADSESQQTVPSSNPKKWQGARMARDLIFECRTPNQAMSELLLQTIFRFVEGK